VFVLLQSDTQTGHALADEASRIRNRMHPTAQAALLKGSTLYAAQRRESHEPFRRYVRDSLCSCTAGIAVTSSSTVLQRYRTLAPDAVRARLRLDVLRP